MTTLLQNVARFQQLLKYPVCGVITFILYKNSHPAAIPHIDFRLFRINQTAWSNPWVIHRPPLFFSRSHIHIIILDTVSFRLIVPFLLFTLRFMSRLLLLLLQLQLHQVVPCFQLLIFEKGNLVWSQLHNQCRFRKRTFKCRRVCTVYACMLVIWKEEKYSKTKHI